ncbi:MAG: type II secretion system protein [Actinomycetota bacterium]|jgi:prepilin-type N-terminal cleavage/methylation domain-containing protein
MIERINRKRQNEEGFTLVELLVVIVILGILAAIVVFAVGGITDKGESNASKTDVAVLETAEEAYFANQSASVYTTEGGLVTGKYLRAVSSKNSICLSTADNKSYSVVPQGGTCPAGTDWNGTGLGAGTEDN